MFCVSKAPKSLPIFALKTAAACFAILLFHFEPSSADPNQPRPRWGTKLESDAEYAYRSVYERFLADYRHSQTPHPKEDQPERAEGGTPDIPELPSRKTGAATTQDTVADAIDAELSGAPDVTEDRLANTLTPSLIGRPRNLGDVLTTQVAGSNGDEPDSRTGPAPRNRGDQYCTNIATAAADARFVWQQKQLLETEEQVKNRIADLEAKIAEYQKWLARRDEFSRKAQSSVTGIYAKMRPDAAAQQLMALDEEMAAAVIIKLSPRTASTVMAEMDAQKAARLSAIISGAAKGPKGKPAAPPQDRGT